MLKNLFGLLFLFVIVFPAFAEEPQQHLAIKSINMGGGYSHYASTYNGYNLVAELSLDLNRHMNLSLGARYIDASGVPEHTGVKGWIKSPGIYANLYIFIINKPKHRLKAGGGVTYQSYELSYSSLSDGEPESHLINGTRINGNVVVDYEYSFYQRYLLGTRFGGYPIGGNGGFSLTAYFGYRF